MNRWITAILALGLSAPAVGATFELDNGDRLSGEVVEETDAGVVLEHPVLGRVLLPRERLAVKEPEPPPQAQPGLFGTRLLVGWKRELAIGLTGAEGNSQNFNLTGALDLDFENDARRWRIDGRAAFKSEDRNTSESNALLASVHDWLFPETPWFLFVRGAYDYDRFKTWKHRLSAGAGPGYDVWLSELFDLRTRLGAAVTREFQGTKDTQAEALWGVEAEWLINSSLTFNASNVVYPALNDLGELRNLSKAEYKVRITEDPVLNLNLGVTNEYESDAPPGDEKNDLTYYGTLGLEF